MRDIRTLAVAAALAVTGSAAFAWGDMYMGDGTNNPNSNMLVHEYHGANACPPGLQPVIAGGVICCGVPNAGAYIDRPGKVRRVHKPVVHVSKPKRGPVAVEGVKGVVLR